MQSDFSVVYRGFHSVLSTVWLCSVSALCLGLAFTGGACTGPFKPYSEGDEVPEWSDTGTDPELQNHTDEEEQSIDTDLNPDTDTGDTDSPDTGGDFARTCTDGMDCYCDRVRDPKDALYDPHLLFCEDFEDPILNWSRDSEDGDNGDSGWFQTYRATSAGCYKDTDYKDVEGSEEHKCINVVQEDACDSPDKECIFQGQNSLGIKFRPDKTGSLAGVARFSEETRRIGFTYAYKYSSNFVFTGQAIRSHLFSDGSNKGS